MNKLNIHVENLNLRLRGVSPERGRAAVNGLGAANLERLSNSAFPSLKTDPKYIDNLQLKPIISANQTTPGELQYRIAAAVTEGLTIQNKRVE